MFLYFRKISGLLEDYLEKTDGRTPQKAGIEKVRSNVENKADNNNKWKVYLYISDL